MSEKRELSIWRQTLIIAVALAFSAGRAQGQSTEELFKKTEQLATYMGSRVGGDSDQHARFIAHNFSRLLAGPPSFENEYMDTAPGVHATNYLYNSALGESSVILANTISWPALAIYNSPVTHHDSWYLEWIGSPGKRRAICLTTTFVMAPWPYFLKR